jgi:hypothetical protein
MSARILVRTRFGLYMDVNVLSKTDKLVGTGEFSEKLNTLTVKGRHYRIYPDGSAAPRTPENTSPKLAAILARL